MSNNYYYDEEIELLISQLGMGDAPVNQASRSVPLDAFYARRRRAAKRERVKVEHYKQRLEQKNKSKMKQQRRQCLWAESGVGPIDTRQGVQLTSREITSLAERPMYTGDHAMSDATIKETAWDLSRIVERPALVTSFEWTSSSPRGTVMYRGSIPAAILPIKLARIPFETFQYWAGDVVLRLQVAGSPIVQGIIAMTFVPLVTTVELGNMQDFPSLTINPTVYLYANTNTHAELRIPYNHFQSYLDTDFPADRNTVSREQNLGFVQIYVFDPLIAIGSVTSINCSLFSMLENNQFKVPRISSNINVASTRALFAESGIISSALHSLTSVGMSVLNPLMEDLGHTAKNLMTRVSNITPQALINAAGTKALPSNFVGDAIDHVGGMLEGALGFLGLDNPTIPMENMRTAVKANGSMNYAVGPEHIEKLSVMPSALSLTMPETFGTVTDEMDVGYLYRKYSYLGSFSIPKTAAVGNIVYSIPMSPFPTLQKIPNTNFPLVPCGDIIQNTTNFPLISYLGLPYRWWTGGLKIKFIVCSSSLHTCKLFVAFNYGVWTPPTTLLDATSQYGIAIEISQGSNEFEFAIPYVALQPYKEVCRGVFNPSNSMGTMNVAILNPLVAPSTVAESISVNVFIAGSDDFSYEFLAGMNPAHPIYPNTTFNETTQANQAAMKTHYARDYSVYADIPIAESGVLTQQTIAPTNVVTTITDLAVGEDDGHDIQVAPPQLELQVDDHFGITGVSLRNLAKKYQLIGQFPLKPIANAIGNIWSHARISAEDVFSIPYLGKIPPYITPTAVGKYTGLLAWMSAMYRQFKGGLRFKIVIETPLTGTAAPVVNGIFSSASVYWTPGATGPRGTKSVAFDLTDTVTMMPQSASYYTTSAGGYFIPIQNTNRLCVVNGRVSNVLEFEMPYSSNYLSTLTYTGAIIADNAQEKYFGLGSLDIVVSGVTSDFVMTVYAAFADETRFGTLYKVPRTYVPALFTVDASEGLTVNSNFGWGEYRTGNELAADDYDMPYAEAGLLSGLLSQVKDLGLGNIDVETPQQTQQVMPPRLGIGRATRQPDPEDCIGEMSLGRESTQQEVIDGRLSQVTNQESSTGNNPMNPQTGTGRTRKTMPFQTWFARKVRHYVAQNGGVSRADLCKFIGSLTHRYAGQNVDKALRGTGVYASRDGDMYGVSQFYGRRRTNRRPLRRRT
jgi:hypothetical protein